MSAAAQQKPEIKIKLSVVKGPHQGQVFQLNKSVVTIGRGPENDIVLINDPLISRAHVRLGVVDQDLEINNTSGKNAVFVQGENVQKWKLVNNSKFVIGDSEINVEYDLGQAVVSVPTAKPANVVPLKTKPTAKSIPPVTPKNRTPVRKAQQAGVPQVGSYPPQMNQQQIRPMNGAVGMARPAPNAMPGPNPGFQRPAQAPTNTSFMASPKFKFYLIAIIALGVIYFNFMDSSKVSRARKIKATLKYEDEIAAKLASENEINAEKRREAKLKEKNRSPQYFRIEENFVKGMREFQAGNYIRAQEHFQLILNLNPDHALAKRYHYLSKVRFDELVQEKLMLGESYFKKHNFRMCASYYRQVMNMLNGKNNDQKYKLAEVKGRECELADEGIQ